LAGFLDWADALRRIPVEPDERTPSSPCWNNPWFSGLDAVALYGFIAAATPRLYLEVGSGVSTRFARRAIIDNGLDTRVVSIDPEPRVGIDGLCDSTVRQRLEDAGEDIVEGLRPGDIVFFDGSHRVFTNSDCVVAILELLPRLPAGVFVHFHDVFLPYDYPVEWNDRYYSEQYLLAAWLLGGGNRLQIELPNAFVSADESLQTVIAPLWSGPLAAVPRGGGSFWLRTC
jgi:hypothetical protein